MASYDPVEAEYLRAMDRVWDPDEAYELVVGLRQYREMFKLPSPEEPSDRRSS